MKIVVPTVLKARHKCFPSAVPVISVMFHLKEFLMADLGQLRIIFYFCFFLVFFFLVCVCVCFFFSPNKSNYVLTDISSVAKIILLIWLFVHYKHEQRQSDAAGSSVLLTVLMSENSKNKTRSVVQGAPGAQAAMTQR